MGRQAIEIARRYRLFGTNAPKESTSGFFLILDIMTFFDAFHSRLNDVALDIVTKIKIIPLVQTDIDMMIATFRNLSYHSRYTSGYNDIVAQQIQVNKVRF